MVERLRELAEANQLLQSSREHLELVELIGARDADGAERLMRRHLSHVRGIWAKEGPRFAGDDAAAATA